MTDICSGYENCNKFKVGEYKYDDDDDDQKEKFLYCKKICEEEDKESEIRKILNFCELEWDEKCLNPNKNSKTPIRTVSVSQARQPIYRSSVNSSGNFDKYLEKMYSILK